MQIDKSDAIRAPIIAILIIEAFALIARSFLELELVKSGFPDARANSLSNLIVPPILLVMLFPILRQHRHFLARRFTFTILSFRTVSTAILVGILLRLAYWGKLTGFVALGIYRSADSDSIVGPLVSFSCPPIETLLLHILTLALLVPIVEEAINRGFLLYSLLYKGRLFAILLSSALFAIAHSPSTIVDAFVIGLFLAVFSLNSGSLWLPIIAHATFNSLIALDWLCLIVQWNPLETTNELFAIGILLSVVSACALFTVSRLVGKNSTGTGLPPQH